MMTSTTAKETKAPLTWATGESSSSFELGRKLYIYINISTTYPTVNKRSTSYLPCNNFSSNLGQISSLIAMSLDSQFKNYLSTLAMFWAMKCLRKNIMHCWCYINPFSYRFPVLLQFKSNRQDRTEPTYL